MNNGKEISIQNGKANGTQGPRFLYFSCLMGLPVFDKNHTQVGVVYDIVAKSAQVYPLASSLIIRRGTTFNRSYAVIPWGDIVDIDRKEISLASERSAVSFSVKPDNREELTLRRDMLDQQVVDTYNHKVIRVNDIHLLYVDRALMVAHVDISVRGLIRRLGFERPIDFLVGSISPDAEYLKVEHLISWKFIQPLSINPVSMTIKVDIPQKQFSSIPAADLGEVFLDLSINHQCALFKSLDSTNKAKIFLNIDFKTQYSLIEELSDREAGDLLNSLPADEATDFLEKLPSEMMKKYLGLVETKYSKKLAELLGYSSDSAGGLMTTEFFAVSKETTVETVLRQIKEKTVKVEPVQFVYIVDENNRLVGSTNFRRLILADPQAAVCKTAFLRTYSVQLYSSVKEVAYLMEKYKYYAVPVVDEQTVLKGIITVDDILSQVIAIAWRRLKSIKIKLKQ